MEAKMSAKDWIVIWRHDPGHMAIGNSTDDAHGDPRALYVLTVTPEVLWGVIFAIDEDGFELATEPGSATYYTAPKTVRQIRFADVKVARIGSNGVAGP
jgi:hypothetical protein